ncbi:MAG TPA: GGDEF domain-containing protein [Kineosporiaceae bacterium]
MTWHTGWRRRVLPPHPASAAWMATAFTVTAGFAQLAYWLVTPRSPGLFSWASLVLPAALLTLAFAMARSTDRVPPLLWVLFPQLGLGAIAYLDVTSHDVSASAQVFFCLPVLYAAAQLPASAAWGTAVLAAAGDLTVTLSVEPLARALTDACFVVATLAAMTLTLTRAMRRQWQLVERLRMQAAMDPLTGLATRRELDGALLQLQRIPGGGPGTALILLDVDHFKEINDRFGHPVGDLALRHLATLLRLDESPWRQACDDAEEVVGRLGGDEFALLLLNCPAADAERRATGIVTMVRSRPLTLADGTTLPLSMSAGVGYRPDGADRDPVALYQLADRSLYQAKHAGRGRVGQVNGPGEPAGGRPERTAVSGPGRAPSPAAAGSERLRSGRPASASVPEPGATRPGS